MKRFPTFLFPTVVKLPNFFHLSTHNTHKLCNFLRRFSTNTPH